jgi:hypothetical protein
LDRDLNLVRSSRRDVRGVMHTKHGWQIAR